MSTAPDIIASTTHCPHGRPRDLCGICIAADHRAIGDVCRCGQCREERCADAIDAAATAVETDWCDIVRRAGASDCHMDSFLAWLRRDADRADLLARVACGAALGSVAFSRVRPEWDEQVGALVDLAERYRQAIGRATLEEPHLRHHDSIGEYAWIAERAAALMERDQ